MNFRDRSNFDSRLETAARARAAIVARFMERPGIDDPIVLARRAERHAIAVAREARAEQRMLNRLAENERRAKAAALDRENEAARMLAALEADVERTRIEQDRLKEARDARYAARKAKIRLRR